MRPYTEEALNSAYQEVRNGNLSLRAAAKKYSVPVTTLHDRKTGKIEVGAKWGKKSLLSSPKEKELIDYAMKRADLGIGFSKPSFLRFAGQFAKAEGIDFKDGIATEKWWRCLKLRHPTFSLRTAESTTVGRHMAMTRMRISRYFGVLKSTLDENSLLDEPTFIWNMDETGLSLATKPPKVLARKGTKVVHSKANNSRELITVIACGNAEGSALPPHVIIPGKTKRSLNSYDTLNAPEGTNISVSDSGWTKSGIMDLWFSETFLKNIGPERPQILIMDGHESHHHVELIERARAEGIIMVELPSKTSHFTQPFDRTVFKSLKSSWGRNIHEFACQTGVTVGHGQFFRVLTKAWRDGITKDNIAAGFRATGICPYNPGAIPEEAYAPSELYSAVADIESSDSEPLHVLQPHTSGIETTNVPESTTASIENANVLEPTTYGIATDNVIEPTTSGIVTAVSLPTTSVITKQTLPLTVLQNAPETAQAPESTVYSINVRTTPENIQEVVDLPITVNESGIVELLEQQLGQENQRPLVNSHKSGASVDECTDAMALRVVESALTSHMKLSYELAYEGGRSINDSMFTTWKLYKDKLGVSHVKTVPQPSNPLLVFPKQNFDKKPLATKRKSNFFVISSDDAYKEKLEAKLNKERKFAEVEERKRQRLVKKDIKEQTKKCKTPKSS